jgi:rhamnopyranosyl-N-acetylglucosaminyl-diphospho-decaprenol beta-1,3/1,4-galactofuranosyltransferase
MAAVENPKVVAMVLSHNAPQSLARCLAAIAVQTQLPAEIIVVDNASSPPIEETALVCGGISVRVLRSDTNIGPAGGWAIALRYFLTRHFTHCWLMDDDIVPEPECLAVLWSAAKDEPTTAFVTPVSIQPDGHVGRWGSWCGFLLAREIVEKVGVPMEELFWWEEDTEYCHWRIPQAGFTRRVIEEAVVHHDAIRQGGDIPSWKYYYESRNMLYYHLHIVHIRGKYIRNISRLIVRAIVRQKRRKAQCLWAIVRGLYDGAFGHLGIRYPVVAMQERDLDPASARRSIS